MADYQQLPELLSNAEIDVFYHFAWEGSGGVLRADETTQLRNVKCSCEAVRASKALDCEKFIFASSIMEYEIAALMGEEKTPPASSIYCSAKIAANYMCRAVSGALGLVYIPAVISNIYGPGERSPRLVNTSIRKLLKKEHTSFSSGEQLYDFVYITDAAKMFAEIGEKGIANKTYYIGNQQPRQLKEFLCEMRDVVAPGLEINLGEIPFNGVSLTYQEFNANAVLEDTGFKPIVSFAEGIWNTAQWIRMEEGI